MTTTAILAAQQLNMTLQEWLDSAVAEATMRKLPQSPVGQLPLSPACADLFCALVNRAPEALQGPWRVMLEYAKLDNSLWDFPVLTVEDYENGVAIPAPILNRERLRVTWAKYVSAAFVPLS